MHTFDPYPKSFTGSSRALINVVTTTACSEYAYYGAVRLTMPAGTHYVEFDTIGRHGLFTRVTDESTLW